MRNPTDPPLTDLAADATQLLHALQAHQIELTLQNEELQKSRDAAEAAAARYADLYDFAPVGYLTLDRGGYITRVNLTAAQLLGSERAHVAGKRLGTWVGEAAVPAFNTFLAQSFVPGAQPSCELALRVNGQVITVQVNASVSADGHECRLVLVDITARKNAEQALRLSASVFTHAREGIMITDAAGSIVEVNDAFTRITGYSHAEVRGQNPRMLQSGHQSEEFYAAMWKELIDKGYWSGEIWNRRKGGEVYAEMQTVSAVLDASGQTQSYVALFSDVTSVKLHQQQLERMAHYDPLTGLPNRLLLADRLHQAILQSQRRGQALAVAFMDLDGFKAVNDQYGHDMGDHLLIALAQRLKLVLREGDTLARLGGDEFVVLLVDLDQSGGFDWVLDRLLHAAAEPLVVDGTTLQVSASIGVAQFPHDGVQAQDLLRHADQAMYQAKLDGRNRWRHFDADVDSNGISGRSDFARL